MVAPLSQNNSVNKRIKTLTQTRSRIQIKNNAAPEIMVPTVTVLGRSVVSALAALVLDVTSLK